jgi:beta-lactamase regulating signal transducer with metallopeptidase domain
MCLQKNIEEKKMNYLIDYKTMILKTLSVILFFQTTLFGSTAYNISESAYSTNSYVNESTEEATSLLNVGTIENTEVALDSFGSMSVMIMLVLTSLLGAFFVRDEFSGFLK